MSYNINMEEARPSGDTSINMEGGQQSRKLHAFVCKNFTFILKLSNLV